MENLPFDLPHTIYINILRNLKGLGVLNDIYYVAFINKFLWDQGAYYVFNKIDEDSKHTLIAKGLVVAKHQNFRKTNLKAMKATLEQSLMKATLEQSLVDLDAINRKKAEEASQSHC